MAVIQIKRGTAADWLAANPILAQGELGLETDTNKMKAGNGTSSWFELQYIAGSGGGGGGGAVTSVNSKTGDVVLVKADLGLGEVDNTSDAAKPISSATQTALDDKADDSDITTLDAKIDTKAAQTDLDALATRVGTNEGDISTKIGAVVEDTNATLGSNLNVKNFTIVSDTSAELKTNLSFIPTEDGQQDLGAATNKWKDVYVEDGVAFTDKRTNDESILSIRDGQLIVTDSTQEVTTAVDLGGTTPDPGHFRNVELDGTGRYAVGASTLLNTNGFVTREFINSPGQFFVINDIDGGSFTNSNRQGFGLVRETMVDGTDFSGVTGTSGTLLGGGNSGGWSLGGVWYYTGGFPYIWTTYSVTSQTPQGAGESPQGTFGSQLNQKKWWEACTIAGVGKKIRVGIADGANSDKTGTNYSNRLIQQLWVSNELLNNPTAAALLPAAAVNGGEGWYTAYATTGDYENMGTFPASSVGFAASRQAGQDKGYRFRWSTFGNTTLNQLPYVSGVPSINDQIAAATGLSYYLVYEPTAADKAAANVTLATGTTSADNPFYASAEVVLLQFQQPKDEITWETSTDNVFTVNHTDIGAVQSSPLFQTYAIDNVENIIESGLSVQGIESIRATVSEIVLQAVIGYYMVRQLDASERATVRTTFAPIIQAASTGQLQEVYDLVAAVTADPLYPQELLDAILDRTAFYLKNYPVF